MNKFPGIYRAKVLATDSGWPEELGRIKAEIYPMLIGKVTALGLPGVDGIEIDDLPWVIPAMSLFAGAGVDNDGNSYGSFAVPEVGSFVLVLFEGGDIHQPVYFSEAQTKTYGVPAEALVDYPYTKVWRTKNGIVITINDKEYSEEVKILHPSGTYLQIDSSGNVNVDSKGDVNVDSEGDVNVNSSGNVVISGSTVNINP